MSKLRYTVDVNLSQPLSSSGLAFPADAHQEFMAVPLRSSTHSMQNMFCRPLFGPDDSTTGYGARDVLRHKEETLKAFVANRIDLSLWGELTANDLLEEALQTVIAAVRYFPNRAVVLRANAYSETPHKVELWIQGRDDISAELDILDRLDNEWLADQTAKLRRNVLIFLE